MIKKGEHKEIRMISPKIPATLAMDGKAVIVNIEDIKGSLHQIAVAAIKSAFSDSTDEMAKTTADAIVAMISSGEISDLVGDAFATLFADVVSRAVNDRVSQIEASNVAKN